MGAWPRASAGYGMVCKVFCGNYGIYEMDEKRNIEVQTGKQTDRLWIRMDVRM